VLRSVGGPGAREDCRVTVNAGPGRSKLVCIHASPTFATEWLE